MKCPKALAYVSLLSRNGGYTNGGRISDLQIFDLDYGKKFVQFRDSGKHIRGLGLPVSDEARWHLNSVKRSVMSRASLRVCDDEVEVLLEFRNWSELWAAFDIVWGDPSQDPPALLLEDSPEQMRFA